MVNFFIFIFLNLGSKSAQVAAYITTNWRTLAGEKRIGNLFFFLKVINILFTEKWKKNAGNFLSA